MDTGMWHRFSKRPELPEISTKFNKINKILVDHQHLNPWEEGATLYVLT